VDLPARSFDLARPGVAPPLPMVCVTSLRPVAEHLSVSSVRDKFLWKLSDSAVQVVHNHMHDGGRVYTYCRVIADSVRSVQQHVVH